MRATGGGVHLGLCHLAVARAEIHGTLDFWDRLNDQTVKILNKYTLVWVLLEL